MLKDKIKKMVTSGESRWGVYENSLFYFWLLFETRSYYIARLALNLQSSCLCLPSAGITGVYYHTNFIQFLKLFFYVSLKLCQNKVRKKMAIITKVVKFCSYLFHVMNYCKLCFLEIPSVYAGNRHLKEMIHGATSS
jgi:hypothetical protein